MSEMIERVAKAIWESERLSPWEHAPEAALGLYRQNARFAISAMRDPTEAMLDAGDWIVFDGDQEDLDWSIPVRAWRAMIDEALK